MTPKNISCSLQLKSWNGNEEAVAKALPTCVKKQGHPAMIIELKKNKSPETALAQIKEKQYFDSLSHYRGDLLFVGINYDEDAKTHECRIEKFVKV